jgi:hypothetical protein
MFKKIGIIFLLMTMTAQYSFAAINFSASPLKYEITVNPGDSVTRTAKIFNGNTS